MIFVEEASNPLGKLVKSRMQCMHKSSTFPVVWDPRASVVRDRLTLCLLLL